MAAKKLADLFPKDFLWGASISAHQTEGGTHNQWSVWELENAKALASQASYKDTWLPRWGEIKPQALNPDNYVSGKAADHFHRYKQDFDLLKRLNMNAFRFSIEWSRIQPHGPNDWDHEAVEHYREYLRQLRQRGIEPVVTLWHFTHPVWFEQKGGFSKYGNLKYFVRFAERVMRELGREVRYVITFSEPDTYTSHAYYLAAWPPQKHNWFMMLETYRNMLMAHNLVYKALRRHRRQYRISLAKTYAHLYPADKRRRTRLAAWALQFATDTVILRRVKHCMDFIAVNYYFADRVKGFKIDNPNRRVSDVGWDMHPGHIEHVLKRLHKKYKKPLLITENGVADEKDAHRRWWLEETLKALSRTQRSGVKLIGYVHWSLIDNFEWASGFWPRFGLYEVNYKTYKRTPRASALWFANVLKKLRPAEGKHD